MGTVELEKISGGYSVAGFGTVTRDGVWRPSKVLRDTKGRNYQVEARARFSTVVDINGVTLGSFRRNFWTRHGVVEWGADQFDFKAGVWSSSYQLLRDDHPVATVSLGWLSDRTLKVDDSLDPVLVLFFVALGAITSAYTAAAASSGG